MSGNLLLVVVGLLGLEDGRSLQDSGFNSVWFKIDIKIPFLHLFGVCNHSVELFDASDSLWWFLEEALSDVSHNALVFSDLGWDSDEGAKFWRQIDILPFLTNFKQRLIY